MCKKTKKYKNFGEVDFEDHEIETIQEEYEKLNEELENW